MKRRSSMLSELTNFNLQALSKEMTTIVEEDPKQQKDQVCQFCSNKNANPKNVLSIMEIFVTIECKKTAEDKKFICDSLASHFLFFNLSKDKRLLDHVIDNFKLCKVYRSQYLMKQNDEANCFFILKEGQLTVEVDQKIKRTIQEGETFGEKEMLYSVKRFASLRANKTSFLWVLDRKIFEEVVKQIQTLNSEETRKFIEGTDFFNYLSESQKCRVLEISTVQKFPKGKTIYYEGELSCAMYIVKSGHVAKISSLKEEKVFYGKCFGEYSVPEFESLECGCQKIKHTSNRWGESVVALEDVEALVISSNKIEEGIVKNMPLILVRNKAKELIRGSKIFQQFNGKFLDLLLDCFEVREVVSGEEIQIDGSIFFVFEGDCSMRILYEQNKNSTQTLKETDENINQWKEKKTHCNTLYGSLEQQMKGTVKFHSDGKIVLSTVENLLKSLPVSLDEALKLCEIERNQIEREERIMKMKNLCERYRLEDLKVLTKLGESRFGSVFLVTDPSKTHLFTLRCISKTEAVRNKLESQIIAEKKFLENFEKEIDFCPIFFKTFKDENFIYFLLEYIKGLELFDVIRIIGVLSSEQICFYVANLIVFLEKIHSKCYVHRDLKPENIIVTENGYIKLIDFASSKNLSEKIPGTLSKTHTIMGTPHYMAPEIISGSGYTTFVDLWSLGVITYECAAGYLPFGEEFDDPYKVYEDIMKRNLSFPEHMYDEQTNSFISQLLHIEPHLRLNGNYENLRKHPFLSNICWNDLINKKTKPVFEIPQNKLIEVEKLMRKTKILRNEIRIPEKTHLTNKKDKEVVQIDWDLYF